MVILYSYQIGGRKSYNKINLIGGKLIALDLKLMTSFKDKLIAGNQIA